MTHYDHLHRFLFDHHDIRGEIVSLEQAYQDVLKQRAYPTPIRRLLGEFLAAASLLSSLLKFDGIMTLQARGDGPLQTIMAECTRNQNLRAIAQFDEAVLFPDDITLPQLLGNLVRDRCLACAGKADQYTALPSHTEARPLAQRASTAV